MQILSIIYRYRKMLLFGFRQAMQVISENKPTKIGIFLDGGKKAEAVIVTVEGQQGQERLQLHKLRRRHSAFDI